MSTPGPNSEPADLNRRPHQPFVILRELVAAPLGCYHFGTYHAPFLLALSAADATAKRRFPQDSVGTRLKRFFQECIPKIFGAVNYKAAVNMPEDLSALPLNDSGRPDIPDVGDDFSKWQGKPRFVSMQAVLYHAFRCALTHQANLIEVEFMPPCGRMAVKVDTKVRVSADVILGLLNILIHAPENAQEFAQAGR